jgi:hypothetical protein
MLMLFASGCGGGSSTGTGSNTNGTTVTQPDNNAKLASLSISGTLSPAFSATTQTYSAAVANAVSSITVTPTVATATATVKVNGTSVTSGTASGAMPLAVGPNTINVVATSGDKSTTKTYTLTVTRQANPGLTAQSGIYVTSSGTLGPYPSSVVVFARDASGTDAPIRTLSGKATLMIDNSGSSRRPWATFVDTVNNELVVANNGGALISTFSVLASGNTAPLRYFSDGTNTGYSWSTPDDIFVDTVNNEIFVSSNQNGAISVFSRSSNSGLTNTTPIRVISNSTLNPFGIAVDVANNEIYVASYGTHDISVFSRTANSLNAVPLRVIKGALTTLSFPESIAIDPVNNEIFVLCNGAPGTLVFSRTANGNVAPLRSFGVGGFGIAVDTVNNEIFEVNGSNSISVYSRTATNSSTPLRTLTGPNSTGGLSLPQKITVVP